ncbi:MAG: hypothetical protein FWG30_08625 [Eubacteriaceae bacterium]|nr:hypothetical protein [Eubacteriaceae bacterium]
MNEMLKSRAIKSEPIYSLEVCILQEADSLSDAELSNISALVEKRKEDFQCMLTSYSDKRLSGFLSDVAELSAKKLPFAENLPSALWVFYYDRYVYIFSHEDQIYCILPDELREIYENMGLENSLSGKALRTKEICGYASALLCLYGAYEIKHFVKVWNQYHTEKIEMAEAERFFQTFEEYRDDYFLDVGYSVSETLSSRQVAELKDTVKKLKLDYYMPAESDIAAFIENEPKALFANASCLSEMSDFLAGLSISQESIDELLSIMSEPVSPAYPASLREALARAAFPTDNGQACESFETLYTNLNSNKRVWQYRGYTPSQISEMRGVAIQAYKI